MTSLKYRYLQTLRDRGNMFWGIVYPIILATFFFVAFGDLGRDNWKEIPVALVGGEELFSDDDVAGFMADPEAYAGTNDMESFNEKVPAALFTSFLDEMDGDLVLVTRMEEDEALSALADGAVEGVFFADNGEGNPALTVGGNGLRETMLSMLLDAYVKNAAMYRDIAMTHPEGLYAAMEVMSEDSSHLRETNLGGKTYETVLEYFFACIAMMCFFGCFTGEKLAVESVANVSAEAARRSISPEKKSLAVLADLLVGISIQFVNSVIFLIFLRYVLGISITGSFAGMMLICLLGAMTGVSLGMVVGSMHRLTSGMKTLILVAVPLFLCFLAGLMVGEMKYTIERSFPIINRLNPAALISDALYFLNVYNDPAALRTRLLLLATFAAVMTFLAFISLRRTRYESI